MSDNPNDFRPLPGPQSLPAPTTGRPPPPAPTLPLAKCMVVFLFLAPGQEEVHTGRIFLQGVANLSSQAAIEQTEKAIIDHHQGAMTSVTVIDWKRLDA